MRNSNPEITELGGGNILSKTTSDMKMMIDRNYRVNEAMEVQN